MKKKNEVLEAIHQELTLRKEELTNQTIGSIYFGGGTPSLLNKKELESFLEAINKHFNIEKNPEITLEANPDDLTTEKIKQIKDAGINRLSIGIQSFRDEDLKWMNRAHSGSQAIKCVKESQQQGLDNISIDLIYGFPSLSLEAWKKNLNTAFSLNVRHLSCYSLTVEPQTPLSYFIKKGKYSNLNEELSIEHFKSLITICEEEGWVQYEISNFCKDNQFSKHNTSYWKNEAYLGLGPSAHSYNGKKRRWNVSNNKKYVENIENDLQFYNEEIISADVSYNEYIMTAFRTIWGCQLEYIEDMYGIERKKYFLREVSRFIDNKWVQKKGSKFYLSNEGKLFADTIASELMA